MSRQLSVEVRTWEAAFPVRISGHVMTDMSVVVVLLSEGSAQGRGEAAGVFYRNETAHGLAETISSVRAEIQAGIGREALRSLLPPGGARNAIDCALWDLEAQLTRYPVWKLAGLEAPRPLRTAHTIGADLPHAMAAVARGRYKQARAIKLKLLGDDTDAARVRAVRKARGDVWLGVDLNQGSSPEDLARLLPTLLEADVRVIEQPFPISDDALLEGMTIGIPVAADESAQRLEDIDGLVGRFDVVNIKLDKCGGLTEALMIAERARSLGLETMVGNMGGTSLAMAPGLVVGQGCAIVDLDGPLFLKADRKPALSYVDGLVSSPPGLWGDAIQG